MDYTVRADCECASECDERTEGDLTEEGLIVWNCPIAAEEGCISLTVLAREREGESGENGGAELRFTFEQPSQLRHLQLRYLRGNALRAAPLFLSFLTIVVMWRRFSATTRTFCHVVNIECIQQRFHPLVLIFAR